MANQEGSFGYDRDLSSLFDSIVAICKEYMLKYEKRDSKVIEFHNPSEISSLVDLSLPEEPITEDMIIEQVQKILKYSVHTSKSDNNCIVQINCLITSTSLLWFVLAIDHPYCFNQLWSGGVDQVGLLGQLLTSTVHTLMYTFEMAPVFTVMEATILRRMRELVGWADGEGDGIFTPGIYQRMCM